MYTKEDIAELEKDWMTNPRWKGISRDYTAEDVVKMRGSVTIDYTLAKIGSQKLWRLFEDEPFVRALGALTGNQAVQMVQAGLKILYASGWQVAADANDALQTYPDLSLYPSPSMPRLVQRINHALMRKDQIEHMQNKRQEEWLAPIVADAEAGFGGNLNTYELIRSLIEAGASAIHLEDQLSSEKKCGHMGGKVLVPGKVFLHKLNAARFAADVMRVPLIIIARTDAYSAKLIRSDFDFVDTPFLTGERSSEGYYYLNGGIPYAIQRGIDFAPYSDIIWCETSKPDIGEAKEFAEGIHEKFPGKWLAYNCSPSFNWKATIDEKTARTFQEKLGEMGYKFQFVTLAGFHTLNASMFDLAVRYKSEGMGAYANFQAKEFALAKEHGYCAIRHQQFVGTDYFDELTNIFSQRQASTTALAGSTEEEQF